MLKVNLTEREIRGIGIDRYVKLRWKLKVLGFVVGLTAMIVCAVLWEASMAARVLMFICGGLWLAHTIYQGRQEGKAGAKFLEEVKNANHDN